MTEKQKTSQTFTLPRLWNSSSRPLCSGETKHLADYRLSGIWGNETVYFSYV